MQRNDPLVLKIEKLLDEERAMHAEYLELFKLERSAVANFQEADLTSCVSRRESLQEKLSQKHSELKELMDRFPHSTGKRLSQLVEENCHPADKKRLIAKIDLLKSTAQDTRNEGQEFQKVLGFVSQMVNGTISLIWSVTQHVFESYGRAGKIKQSYQPATTTGDKKKV
jgi:hypothetical protein